MKKSGISYNLTLSAENHLIFPAKTFWDTCSVFRVNKLFPSILFKNIPDFLFRAFRTKKYSVCKILIFPESCRAGRPWCSVLSCGLLSRRCWCESWFCSRYGIARQSRRSRTGRCNHYAEKFQKRKIRLEVISKVRQNLAEKRLLMRWKW